MFTDRFIKLPILLYRKKEYEQSERMDMSIENLEGFKLDLRILPSQIESWQPDFESSESDDLIYTAVRTKSGDEWKVYLSVTEFEKRLNDSDK